MSWGEYDVDVPAIIESYRRYYLTKFKVGDEARFPSDIARTLAFEYDGLD